jgi:hypothetical protein
VARSTKAAPSGPKQARKPVSLAKSRKPATAAPRRKGGAGRPPSLRRLLGSAALTVVFVLLGLGLIGLGAWKLAYAAGWAGTPGTIHVTSCHDEGGSDPSWACSGVYHSGDQRTVDPHARVKPSSNVQGRTIDVRHVSGHDYSATDGATIATPIALIFFGALPLVAVLWGGRAALGRWVRDVRAARARRRVPPPAGRAPSRARPRG